jgi:hypothetical protein
MGRVTAEMLPPPERRLLGARRVPAISPRLRGATVTASRAAFLSLCGFVVIVSDDVVVRALAILPVIIVAYIVGWSDGRRALSLDLLNLGGDRRYPRPTLEPGPDERDQEGD